MDPERRREKTKAASAASSAASAASSVTERFRRAETKIYQFLRAAGAAAAPRRRTGAPVVTQKLVRTITTTTFSTKNVENFRENVEKLREHVGVGGMAEPFKFR